MSNDQENILQSTNIYEQKKSEDEDDEYFYNLNNNGKCLLKLSLEQDPAHILTSKVYKITIISTCSRKIQNYEKEI